MFTQFFLRSKSKCFTIRAPFLCCKSNSLTTCKPSFVRLLSRVGFCELWFQIWVSMISGVAKAFLKGYLWKSLERINFSLSFGKFQPAGSTFGKYWQRNRWQRPDYSASGVHNFFFCCNRNLRVYCLLDSLLIEFITDWLIVSLIDWLIDWWGRERKIKDDIF